ncbi:MAG: restriction endonuclease subunit S, partial [Acetobacter sp.]|nr:restriction endonuclease subunit S [Acetobacter sp.]
KNVKMGFIQHTPEEFIEASIYDQWMTRGYPKNGDVLFTTEAPLGNVAQLYTDEKVVIGQRLITMKPNPEFLLPNFLKWLLMSDPVQRQIHSLATGATVQGIKARLLKTIQLAAPNIEKQKQLDAKLEQAWQITRELEQQYQEKLNTVKHLKTALLAKVFHETPLTAPPHSTPDKESIPKDHTPKESTA